jgi:hypothetical protein
MPNITMEGQVWIGKGLKREKRYMALDLEIASVLVCGDKASLASGASKSLEAFRLDAIGRVEVSDKTVVINFKSSSTAAKEFECKTSSDAEDWGQAIPTAQKDLASIIEAKVHQDKQRHEDSKVNLSGMKAYVPLSDRVAQSDASRDSQPVMSSKSSPLASQMPSSKSSPLASQMPSSKGSPLAATLAGASGSSSYSSYSSRPEPEPVVVPRSAGSSSKDKSPSSAKKEEAPPVPPPPPKAVAPPPPAPKASTPPAAAAKQDSFKAPASPAKKEEPAKAAPAPAKAAPAPAKAAPAPAKAAPAPAKAAPAPAPAKPAPAPAPEPVKAKLAPEPAKAAPAPAKPAAVAAAPPQEKSKAASVKESKESPRASLSLKAILIPGSKTEEAKTKVVEEKKEKEVAPPPEKPKMTLSEPVKPTMPVVGGAVKASPSPFPQAKKCKEEDEMRRDETRRDETRNRGRREAQQRLGEAGAGE